MQETVFQLTNRIYEKHIPQDTDPISGESWDADGKGCLRGMLAAMLLESAVGITALILWLAWRML